MMAQLYFQYENVSFLRLDLRFAGPFNCPWLEKQRRQETATGGNVEDAHFR